MQSSNSNILAAPEMYILIHSCSLVAHEIYKYRLFVGLVSNAIILNYDYFAYANAPL